ncbi:hypothetical protein [Catellatospora citrea]|uniref:DUF4383 domain-containing protein n=1 Tax=Catellatospora citrea TaxID=53366 RepID=A0A8J3KBG6_9ACTN|nr:hypothetical protein [Catellatospora citrea]RKE11090.1 hypothetical protein C8E86_6010 [Catellatospora citrea]GIF96547.1 hypothetical protein Cci01nite_16410 [Catellatospora citrea]
MLTRRYCRIAAVVFFLFTAYPLVVKLAEHRLAHDWAHVVLHLLSMLVAVYAGWLAVTELPARLFTWAVGVGYTLLGTVGWFIDGLLLTTPVAIPLAPVDNIFHLALGLAALAVLARDRRNRATAATSGRPG